MVRNDPKEGNWKSGRSQSGAADGACRWLKGPQRTQAWQSSPWKELCGFLAGGVAGAPSNRVQAPWGQEMLKWFFPGWRLAGGWLSVLGPAAGGGGREADTGTAAAAATAAAAEAALGGQWAGDTGGASFTDKHRASPRAHAQQVSTTRSDLGTAQAGAAGSSRTGAAAGEGDSTTGEGGAGDQGLRPTHHTASGAAHGCRRERPSARLPYPPCSPLGGGRAGLVASGKWPGSKRFLLSIQLVPTFPSLVWVAQGL